MGTFIMLDWKLNLQTNEFDIDLIHDSQELEIHKLLKSFASFQLCIVSR